MRYIANCGGHKFGHLTLCKILLVIIVISAAPPSLAEKSKLRCAQDGVLGTVWANNLTEPIIPGSREWKKLEAEAWKAWSEAVKSPKNQKQNPLKCLPGKYTKTQASFLCRYGVEQQKISIKLHGSLDLECSVKARPCCLP